MPSNKVPFLCLLALGLGLLDQGLATNIQLTPEFRLKNILFTVENSAFVTAENVRKLRGYMAVVSEQMATATERVGRRISIETFRLLVPPSKVAELKAANEFSFVPATWESELATDVRLIKADQAAKAIPADECYGPNRLVQLTDFNIKHNSTANRFLAQFAIFQWGLLTESSDGSKFFLDKGEIQPSVCSVNTRGQYRLINNPASVSNSIDNCIIALIRSENFTAAKMHEICEFTPTPTPSSSWASILSQPVSLFCDNSSSTGSQTKHNDRMPNALNKRCNRQSAAEVLRRHPHFLSSTVGAAVPETLPTLLLVEQNATRDIVLVLDVSGSMAGTRIAYLKRSATMYVKYFVEVGARVSVIMFNETAMVLLPPEKITDDAAREPVAKVIQKIDALGWTNIAGAMIKAMEILGATPPYSKSQTGFVVLLTDGEHNKGEDLNATIKEAAKTSIVFDTICISDKADPRMTLLANLTNGLSFFASTSAPVTVEQEISFAKLARRKVGETREPVLLRAATFNLPTASGPVPVGDTDRLHFTIYLPSVNLAGVNFTATSPTGTVYGSFSSDPSVYAIDAAISTIVITIPAAEIVPGVWSWMVTEHAVNGRKKRSADQEDFLIRHARSTSPGSIIVIGGSGGANSSSTISVDAWLRYPSFSKVTQSSVQKIYAYITNNSAPFTGASVEATVVPATGSTFAVPLKDDGLGADMTANDGTYVAQILPDRMTAVGDYGVTVTMTSPLSRTTSAGKFRVESLASSPVTVPPGRIMDLVVASSVKHQYVAVKFTSPGNQQYEGVPAAYEIRASSSFDQLISNFPASPLVGRIPGQPVGAVLSFNLYPANLTAIQTNVTFFLSAAAVSTDNVTGLPSFPLGATLVYPEIQWWDEQPPLTRPPLPPLPTKGPEVRTTAKQREQPPVQSEWTAGLIAGVATTSVVIVAEVFAIVFVAVKV